MVLEIARRLFVVQGEIEWYSVVHGIVGCLFVILEVVERL